MVSDFATATVKDDHFPWIFASLTSDLGEEGGESERGRSVCVKRKGGGEGIHQDAASGVLQ